MASASKTIGYTLKSGGNLDGIKVRERAKGKSNFLNWTQTKTPETATQTRQKNADRVRRTRPLGTLTKKNANSLHSNDMRRLFGASDAVYVRNSKNKTVLAKGAPAPTTGRPGARPRKKGPELDAWKNQAVQYNGALSRQQIMNPGNNVIGNLKPINVSTKGMNEIPVVKMSAARGGQLGTSTKFANRLPKAAKPSTQIV
jgi:hypothetical protein